MQLAGKLAYKDRSGGSHLPRKDRHPHRPMRAATWRLEKGYDAGGGLSRIIQSAKDTYMQYNALLREETS
jgi:hypothetical protein